jgi:trehalose/maltose hydrolase-like predicted phosphorylase
VMQPTGDPAWTLVSQGYDPLRESIIEARFAISNGFLGVRGIRATTRGTRWVMPARTFVAGLFDTPGTDGAVPELVPAADWLAVHVLVNGQPLVHHPGDVSLYHMTLDMQRGVVFSKGYHDGVRGYDVNVRTQRLVSLHDRSLGLQVIEFDVRSGSVDVTFEALFAGTELGLEPDHIDDDLGLWRTPHSGKRLAMAASASLQMDLAVDHAARAERELSPPDLGGAQRQRNDRSRRRGAQAAQSGAPCRLARGARGARRGLGRSLAAQ